MTRRFLIVEGLYLNTGQLCPLPKLLELKWKYKVSSSGFSLLPSSFPSDPTLHASVQVRIFVDDTLGIGVLGASGKGVVEHFGVELEEVDLVMGTLEAAVGSIGGFAAGRSFVVDHQRLSGEETV